MEIEHGFKILTQADNKKCLLFDTIRSKECIEFALEKRYDRIMLNPAHGYMSTSLKDLLPLKNVVKELIIGSEKIRYIELCAFQNLTMLSLPDNKIDKVDVARFANLKTLICNVNQRLVGLSECRELEHLLINRYSSVSDLSNLPALPTLKKMALIITSISSLNGIEKYSKLSCFEIFSAVKLSNLSELSSLADTIQEVQIESCKNIIDFRPLAYLHGLKKLKIANCGTVASLEFIEKLNNLDYINFWKTIVSDGNLSFCMGIRHVAFDNRKGYSHNVEDFKKKHKI